MTKNINFFIFLNYFDRLILKINIKYYFNIFLNIKHFKNNCYYSAYKNDYKLRNNVSLTIKGVKKRKRILFLSKRLEKIQREDSLREKEINGVEYMVRNKLGKQLPI